jgi:hypothetical protein
MGRGEINLNSAHKLNKKWSTGVLLHASRLGDELGRMDRNGDGFLDTPMFTQYNGINRWKYDGERLKAQFGVKALYENRQGGQMAYYDKSMQHTEVVMEYDPVMGHEMPVEKIMPMYGTGSTVRRVEAFAKTGIIYPQTPYKGPGPGDLGHQPRAGRLFRQQPVPGPAAHPVRQPDLPDHHRHHRPRREDGGQLPARRLPRGVP